MKKFFLSLIVILAFGVYVVRQNSEGSNSVYIAPPPSLAVNANGNSDGQTNTQTTTNSTTENNQTTDTQPVSSVAQNTSNKKTNTYTTTTIKPVVKPQPVQSKYKNGSYIGSSADAYYGNIQVKAVISNGRISDVQFLDYPHDRGTSISINTQAMPYLKSEAIQAQSANVDTVSGASDSSDAFRQSLKSALQQAMS